MENIKWVVQIDISYIHPTFEFDSADEAKAFAATCITKGISNREDKMKVSLFAKFPEEEIEDE